MDKEIIERLKTEARNRLPDEDFNPMDASGGNFDDAYDMGTRHGATMFAQELLGIMGVEY